MYITSSIDKIDLYLKFACIFTRKKPKAKQSQLNKSPRAGTFIYSPSRYDRNSCYRGRCWSLWLSFRRVSNKKLYSDVQIVFANLAFFASWQRFWTEAPIRGLQVARQKVTWLQLVKMCWFMHGWLEIIYYGGGDFENLGQVKSTNSYDLSCI